MHDLSVLVDTEDPALVERDLDRLEALTLHLAFADRARDEKPGRHERNLATPS